VKWADAEDAFTYHDDEMSIIADYNEEFTEKVK